MFRVMACHEWLNPFIKTSQWRNELLKILSKRNKVAHSNFICKTVKNPDYYEVWMSYEAWITDKKKLYK